MKEERDSSLLLSGEGRMTALLSVIRPLERLVGTFEAIDFVVCLFPEILIEESLSFLQSSKHTRL